MQSTIKLFWHLYDNLPPLFPAEIAGRFKNELETFVISPTAGLSEIESKMVRFGYVVWPWNQAYKYFLSAVEEKLGEHFFVPKLSDGLREKYLAFKDFGGTLADLKCGRPASFFTSEERVELCVALVETRAALREYLDRELVGVGKKQYLAKVEEYKILLDKIKNDLDILRDLTKNESEHEILIVEINGQIRDFEHGLCLLGSELDVEAVCQAKDFFAGRKIELGHWRGINIPMQIDFFNS